MVATPPKPLRERLLATRRHGHGPRGRCRDAEPGLGPLRERGSARARGDTVVVMSMSMSMLDGSKAPQVKLGPSVQMIAAMPRDLASRAGLDQCRPPGAGLQDLVALALNPDSARKSRAGRW